MRGAIFAPVPRRTGHARADLLKAVYELLETVTDRCMSVANKLRSHRARKRLRPAMTGMHMSLGVLFLLGLALGSISSERLSRCRQF